MYLEDLVAQPAQTLGMKVLQLLVEDPPAAVVKARALLAGQHSPTEPLAWPALVDLVETIIVHKLPRLSREEIRTMLGLQEVDLKQTRFYEDVFTEGRQEGQRELVLRQLCRRVGGLGADQEAQIRRLSIADLAALGDALLDFQTPAELAAWLYQHLPGGNGPS